MANKRMVVGNWKMYVGSLEQAKLLAKRTRSASRSLKSVDVVVCPPFPFLHSALFRLSSSNYSVGAQSVSVFPDGPHTGESSAEAVVSMGVKRAIIGHSEQRSLGDTDALVSKKIAMAIEAGMTAIVCVGETTREENGGHLDFLKQQIQSTFAGISAEQARKVVLAYEPIWAIGAKEAMSPESIHEMAIFVRKVFTDIFGPEVGLKTKILYGGAVNFRNAKEIIEVGKVDGLLVGRESVNMPGFAELLKAVDQAS